jgi:hypothetical protein
MQDFSLFDWMLLVDDDTGDEERVSLMEKLRNAIFTDQSKIVSVLETKLRVSEHRIMSQEKVLRKLASQFRDKKVINRLELE